MEWFEKEYKKRFENESSLEGVEPNLLWSQINKSIPQKKPTFPYWKWSLMAFLLIGAAATWIFIQKENSTSDLLSSQSNTSIQTINNKRESNIDNKEINVESQVKNEENSTPISNEVLNNNTNIVATQNDKKATANQDLTSFEETNQINNIDANHTPSRGLNDSKTPNRNNQFAKSNSKNQLLENQSLAPIQNSNSQSNSELALESKLGQESIKTMSSESSFNNDVSKKAEMIEAKKVTSVSNEAILNDPKNRNLIEIKQLDLFTIDALHKQNTIDIPSVSKPKIKVEKTSPFAIGIHANANFFSLKYSDQDPELFASDANASLGSMQIGNGFAINIEYQLNQSWSVETGFELNNYENHLDLIITTDTMVLDDFQKVRRAKNIRTVKHHNKLSTFTIPLIISYEDHISDRWRLGASIGASYSIVKSQRGKVLSRNNIIVNYADQENVQFNNFLSLRINPYLKYGISDKVSLSVNAGLSFQNHGIAEVQNLKQSSIIYNAGIGLHYRM